MDRQERDSFRKRQIETEREGRDLSGASRHLWAGVSVDGKSVGLGQGTANHLVGEGGTED